MNCKGPASAGLSRVWHRLLCVSCRLAWLAGGLWLFLEIAQNEQFPHP